jgi:hypothetical protein
MDRIISSQKTARSRNLKLTEWASSQREYIKNLPPDTKKAIRNYTSGEYYTNSENIEVSRESGLVYSDYPEIIKTLISTIKDSPKLNIQLKLFRGVSNIHPIDDIIISPYLSSTSFSKKTASSFIDSARRGQPKCCLYILNMPADFPGLLVGRRNKHEIVDSYFQKVINSSFDDEFEVILPPFVGTTTKMGNKNNVEYYEVNNITFPEINYSGNLIKINY